MNIQFEFIHSDHFQEYLDLVAAWRITYYREFPYLYVGKFEYEQSHLKLYQQEKLSSLLLAKHNQQIIGFSLGMPLLSFEKIGEIVDTNALTDWFKQHNIAENSVYFLEDFMTHPAYREMGVAHHLLYQMELYAKENNFSVASLITIIKDKHHPLKNPSNHEFSWLETGFKKTGIIVESVYPTLMENGATENMKHAFDVWVKQL